MLINFCQTQFKPIIECSQMELDGYRASNLSKDFSENNGFLCDSLQRPPVEIDVRFPLNIDLKKIVFSPTIGEHCSSLIEFLTNREKLDEKSSWLVDSNRTTRMSRNPFQRIALISIDDPSVRRIEITENLDRSSTSNEKLFRFSSLMNLTNCSAIRISIRRTLRRSSCALKFLQVWAVPSVQNSPIVREIFDRIVAPKIEEKPKSENLQEKNGEPKEFLDALTNELMLIPMVLPSGFIIDRTTLEKCLEEDHRWSRPERDPFTLIPFERTTRPIVAEHLKVRIDQFLSEHQDDPNYRRYGRVLDPTHKRKRSTIVP